eukprot:12912733-Alexandrium_andersonii.AAC.1
MPDRSAPSGNPGARAPGCRQPSRRKRGWTDTEWEQWVRSVDPGGKWTVEEWKDWHVAVARAKVAWRTMIHDFDVAHAPLAEQEDPPQQGAAAFLMPALRAHP